jgi:serine/threonine-protein phosphatase 2A regulatory subunit A
MLTDCLEPEMLQSDILPLVLSMATDPVPNIRFNVSKALAEIGPRLPESVVNSAIRPTLSALMQDGDRDVRFFTKRAIAAIG